ncbi:protease inhibitor I42 family protein [Rubellicoccus peritrichatus]|uniref:Protease inhibitor I42 family protein n=1 Tax=Rubellicoccus peritrichatus TaxID=3080537 RepID=A0AAQ3L7K3_9BACT|nr:protease inhibitor I42 family protein [Puniceicoccus sp. CR14]WOO41084.1 protease inhibitor I42 family protein [Puniceicoccus sp. CR14]
MHKSRYFLISLLIASALTGCRTEQAEGDTAHRPMNVTEKPESTGVATARPNIPVDATVLTQADNKGSVAIEQNSNLVIKLPGNPTTGYSWAVTNYDSDVLELGRHEYYAGATGRVGSGGTFVFYFNAIGSGETTVKLKYSRPWEKDSGGDTFSNEVRVIK